MGVGAYLGEVLGVPLPSAWVLTSAWLAVAVPGAIRAGAAARTAPAVTGRQTG
jgi:hypothetical protein